jgi:hypothetical protein
VHLLQYLVARPKVTPPGEALESQEAEWRPTPVPEDPLFRDFWMQIRKSAAIPAPPRTEILRTEIAVPDGLQHRVPSFLMSSFQIEHVRL